MAPRGTSETFFLAGGGGVTKLRAPFPYYGFKGAISAEIWERLGNPPNYVEPFFGSGAILLQRPGGAGAREVVNDKYGLLVNFWRAVKADPAEVAQHALYVVSESDLHARNAYCRERLEELTSRLEGDPEYYDVKLAGWWCYVQCMAIGEAAYARGPWIRLDGKLVNGGADADGIRRAVPCDSNRGIQKSIPFHGVQGLLRKNADALQWMVDLSDRLLNVRILCGDWERAVRPTYTTQHGLTGVFLDPPYDTDYLTYANSDPLLDSICEWCSTAGKDERFRIALCGYEGTLPVDLENLGWSEFAWRSKGGRITTGGQSDVNRQRERVWFSPACRDVAGQLLLGSDCG